MFGDFTVTVFPPTPLVIKKTTGKIAKSDLSGANILEPKCYGKITTNY